MLFRTSCFNLGVGFYRVVTTANLADVKAKLVFQSRCGFLPRRDRGCFLGDSTYSFLWGCENVGVIRGS